MSLQTQHASSITCSFNNFCSNLTLLFCICAFLKRQWPHVDRPAARVYRVHTGPEHQCWHTNCCSGHGQYAFTIVANTLQFYFSNKFVGYREYAFVLLWNICWIFIFQLSLQDVVCMHLYYSGEHVQYPFFKWVPSVPHQPNPPGTEVAITQAGDGTVFLFVCPGFTRILLLASKVQHSVKARVPQG